MDNTFCELNENDLMCINGGAFALIGAAMAGGWAFTKAAH
ncbi:bacteriocin [Clostridium estertheticum]|nr:bacteriocin [Clostridium estertheticum]MBU3178487.1 bacteriocin [Clostridium estertheticum]